MFRTGTEKNKRCVPHTSYSKMFFFFIFRAYGVVMVCMEKISLEVLQIMLLCFMKEQHKDQVWNDKKASK